MPPMSGRTRARRKAPRGAPARGGGGISARKRCASLCSPSSARCSLAAVVGLILTIVYAVKDSMYDAGATVWIITIPQNTPMLVLSAFLAVFIALLVLLLVYLLRGKKR